MKEGVQPLQRKNRAVSPKLPATVLLPTVAAVTNWDLLVESQQAGTVCSTGITSMTPLEGKLPDSTAPSWGCSLSHALSHHQVY